MVFSHEDYESGLRCMDCKEPFKEGQKIAKRIVAIRISPVDGDTCFVTETICIPCDLKMED